MAFTGAPPCTIADLSQAAQFVLHLKFARITGVVPGNILPLAGSFKSAGIWIDDEKARVARYLESGPPMTEWRRLIVIGIDELVRRGVAVEARRTPVPIELIDRYDFDFSRVVKTIARLPRAS